MLSSLWTGFDWFVPTLVTAGALYWAMTPKQIESPIGYGELVPTMRRSASLLVSFFAWTIYLAIHAA